MLGLCFGGALAYALQLAFADRQGGGKTDDYAICFFWRGILANEASFR